MAKKQGTVDLAQIDTVAASNEGFRVQIYHPGTHEDLDIMIDVLGKDSDECQKMSRIQSKKRMAKMAKGGYRSNQVIPLEEIEADNLELLAACTKGWTNVILDGKLVECNKANAVMIYERFPWIKEQVDIAIGDRANFIKG
jgi:hypothetical protein